MTLRLHVPQGAHHAVTRTPRRTPKPDRIPPALGALILALAILYLLTATNAPTWLQDAAWTHAKTTALEALRWLAGLLV